MKVGIDLGSTYSGVAMFDENTNSARVLNIDGGNSAASVPSVLSCQRGTGTFLIGNSAKSQVGTGNRVFEAFKMLLTTHDPEMLKKNGYDNQCTPRFVTAKFLDKLIKDSLRRELPRDKKDIQIENAVICVPEIWRKNLKFRDARSILRDILLKETSMKVKHVRIVTEPEAASAFFAYNYNKSTGKQLKGNLLLIDYGGGTLDITWTEVKPLENNNSIEICYKDSTGEGVNHPAEGTCGVIGRAGIAYMRDVAVNAIKRAVSTITDEMIDFNSSAFSKSVQELETLLLAQADMIDDKFSAYGSYRDFKKVLDEPEETFARLQFNGVDVDIYFSDLYESYQRIIEPALEEQTAEINKKMISGAGIDPTDRASGRNDRLKIALVGGFSSFYLVNRQLAEIYNLDSDPTVDPRTANLNMARSEQAIALGAALIAEGKVTLEKTAPFSIGICTKTKDGKKYRKIFYGLRYHQIVELNKPYFMHDPNGEVVSFMRLKDQITEFIFGFSDQLDRGFPMEFGEEIQKKLSNLPLYGVYRCGFSMDENEILSFHCESVVPTEIEAADPLKPIELDSFERMFNLEDTKEVIVNAI